MYWVRSTTTTLRAVHAALNDAAGRYFGVALPGHKITPIKVIGVFEGASAPPSVVFGEIGGAL